MNLVCFCLHWIVLISVTIKCSNGLRCVTCSGASSNHECNLEGKIEICPFQEACCSSEVRIHGGIYTIKKGCSQARSCKVQKKQNHLLTIESTQRQVQRCNEGFDDSVCHYCCDFDHCNLAEKPRMQSRSESCVRFLPLCRACWWLAEEGFDLEPMGCQCDSLCEIQNNCCSDYREVCTGVLPKELKKKDKYGGATGGEYNKVLPKGGGLPVLRCFVCDEASSNKECNANGRVEECQANQRSCVTEVRTRRGRTLISKRCEQISACKALQKASSGCGSSEGVCFSCCDVDYCNVFEKPHSQNLEGSCLTTFPGFPMCKRRSMSVCDVNNPHCAGSGCKCDSMCKLYNDCCADYDELCAEPENENEAWIFQSISTPPPCIEPESNTGIDENGRDWDSTNFDRELFMVLQDPMLIEAFPSLIQQMKLEKIERVTTLLEERRKNNSSLASENVDILLAQNASALN